MYACGNYAGIILIVAIYVAIVSSLRIMVGLICLIIQEKCGRCQNIILITHDAGQLMKGSYLPSEFSFKPGTPVGAPAWFLIRR